MKCSISMASSRKYSAAIQELMHIIVLLWQLAPPTLNGVDFSLNLNDWAVVKVVGEEGGVYGGRHENHSEVGVRLNHVPEDYQDEIRLLGGEGKGGGRE